MNICFFFLSDDVDSGLSVGTNTCNSVTSHISSPHQLSYIPHATLYTHENDPVATPHEHPSTTPNHHDITTTETTLSGNCDAHGLNTTSGMSCFVQQTVPVLHQQKQNAMHDETSKDMAYPCLEEKNLNAAHNSAGLREEHREIAPPVVMDGSADSNKPFIGADSYIKKINHNRSLQFGEVDTNNSASSSSLKHRDHVVLSSQITNVYDSFEEQEIFVDDFYPIDSFINYTMDLNCEISSGKPEHQSKDNHLLRSCSSEENIVNSITSTNLIESSIDNIDETTSDKTGVNFQFPSDNLINVFSKSSMCLDLSYLDTINEEPSILEGEQLDKHHYSKDKFHKAKQRVNRLSKAHTDDDKYSNTSNDEINANLSINNSTGTSLKDEPTYVNVPFNFENCPDWTGNVCFPYCSTSNADSEKVIKHTGIECKSVLKKRLSASQYTKAREQKPNKKSVTIQDDVEVYEPERHAVKNKDMIGKRISPPPPTPSDNAFADDEDARSTTASSNTISNEKSEANENIDKTMLTHMSPENLHAIPQLSLPSKAQTDLEDSFENSTISYSNNVNTNNIYIDIPMESSVPHKMQMYSPIQEDETSERMNRDSLSSASGHQLRSELHLKIAEDRIVIPYSTSQLVNAESVDVVDSAHLVSNIAHPQSHFLPIQIASPRLDKVIKHIPDVETPPREGSPSGKY